MKTVIDFLYELQEVEVGEEDDSPEKSGRIARLRKKIPAPILAHYDRLRHRGKKGVALVRNGVCTGCHMRMSIGTLATLMHGEDIQLCDTCGRYLFLSDEEKSLALSGSGDPKPAKAKR